MSEPGAWLAANERYLQRETTLLRNRLRAMAERATPPAPAVPDQRRSRWGGLFADASPAAPPRERAVVPPPPVDTMEADDHHRPALLMLAERLNLNPFERQVLLLCAAQEFNSGFARLCARAQASNGTTAPSFALAMAVLDDPAWDAMSPERPLRAWRLIEIDQPPGRALIAASLKADERIVNYLKGLNYIDDRLAPLVTLVEPAEGALPPSQQAVADDMLARLDRLDGALPPMFRLLGADPASKAAVAGAVAARLGMTLYRLRATALPAATGDNETFARLWHREAALLSVALYVDADELDDTDAAQRAAVERMLDRSGGLTFVAARGRHDGGARSSAAIPVARPLPGEQRAGWSDALGPGGEEQAARLAGQFDLDAGAIRAIVAIAGLAGGDDAALWRAALEHTRPGLDRLAAPIEPRAGWDDLELPPRERAQLAGIVAQVRNRAAVYDGWGFGARMSRGQGIGVLFAGDSGTGKTMAAEVLAGELGLLLYRIDLSGVVSKYIGETEKNLRTLFDAAESGGAILFFDEADALFGKRSEVKDSHDRYANIEINYLLQRMESYRGLAILTTNMKAALDPAFVRRLRFIVNFPFPGAAQREAIWRKAFPPKVDTEALDFARLARFNLTGGSIHNAALNAAFTAVAQGQGLTMPLLLEAVRSEFHKLEKPVNEAEFRWFEAVGGAA